MADGDSAPSSKPQRLLELAKLFLKLGTIGFGGPAVHLALMEEEVVVKRKWLTREGFLDLVGATNLIPGPNSTELSMHIGLTRAGVAGLVVAGLCFIVPAAVITGVIAWLYVRYGALPRVQPLLLGVKPAVIAVMLAVIVRLGSAAVKDFRLALVGAVAVVASLYGENELIVLFGGALLGMIWLRLGSGPRLPFTRPSALLAGAMLWISGAARRVHADTLQAPATQTAAGSLAAGGPVPVSDLFLYFLKIGAVLYGSGYVLVAFLEGGVVGEHHWLSREQLLDAISVGQFTPGPLFSTATFVGYVVGSRNGAGVSSAIAATAGIFLPSFIFVAISGWLLRWLKDSPWVRAFLDAVNVVSLALMLAVSIKLGREVLWELGMYVAWPAWVIFVAALIAAGWFRVNAALVILGGALVGWGLFQASPG